MAQRTYAEKIQALLNKAERAGTQDEAESFYGKAQELMTKWAIDDAVLAESRKEKGQAANETISSRKIVIRYTYYDEDSKLLHEVARCNQCRVLLTQERGEGRGERMVHLVGFPSDMDRTEMLFNSLLVQMSTELGRSIEPYVSQMERAEKKRYRKSFRLGYLQRVGDRLAETQRRAARDAGGGSEATSYLPALRNRMEEVDEWMVSNFKVGRKKRSGQRNVDGGAVAAGRAAADRADIGQPQVGGNRGALPR